MRRLVSTTLTKLLIISMSIFGVSAAVATNATASTAPVTPAGAPALDLTGITNQVQFLINEALNITSNNLVICILSGFTAPNCGHNPV